MGEQEVVGESVFAFGGGVDVAVEVDFLEEGLVGGVEVLPEVFGAVDDGARSEFGESGVADGDAPGFEVVAATMGTKDAAGAELSKRHLGEGGDGIPAADGFSRCAKAGFAEDAEECGECGAVGGGAAEEALVEELVASFTRPGSERSAGPVAEPVFGGGERIVRGTVDGSVQRGSGSGRVGGVTVGGGSGV